MNNPLKVHVALNVNDIEKSAEFYRAMFGTEPVKLKPGYAKFDIAEPALNLTLNYVGEVKNHGALNHLGIQVHSSDAVLEARERMRLAGLAIFDEMNTDCCYALQDKVWVHGPGDEPWEVYTVKADAPEATSTRADGGSGPCECGTA